MRRWAVEISDTTDALVQEQLRRDQESLGEFVEEAVRNEMARRAAAGTGLSSFAGIFAEHARGASHEEERATARAARLQRYLANDA